MNNKNPLSTLAKPQSIADMTRELLGEDSEFSKELEDRIGKRQLVKTMAIIRARANLSQKELAAAMNCSQSKVSKLESGDDCDVSIGDLAAYLKATRHEAKVCERKP